MQTCFHELLLLLLLSSSVKYLEDENFISCHKFIGYHHENDSINAIFILKSRDCVHYPGRDCIYNPDKDYVDYPDEDCVHYPDKDCVHYPGEDCVHYPS